MLLSSKLLQYSLLRHILYDFVQTAFLSQSYRSCRSPERFQRVSCSQNWSRRGTL